MKPQNGASAAESSASRIAAWAGLGVAGIGLVVMAGWVFGIEWLRCVVPGLSAMKANKALAFVVTGGALWLLHGKDPGRAKTIMAGVGAGSVIVLGALILTEYLLILTEYLPNTHFGIDRMLFTDLPESGSWFPGRMAPAAALNFVILGTALLCLKRGLTQLVLALALAAGLMAFLSLAGHLYGAEFLYGLGTTAAMELHTTFAFLLLSTGVASACIDDELMAMISKQTTAAVLVRRLLPAAFLVPIILGWLTLQGQRAGLYKTEFETALLVVAAIFIFVMFIWWSARAVFQLDAGRERAEQAIRESELRFRAATQTANDAIILANSDGAILSWNNGARTIFGYGEDEVLGKPLTILMPERYREAHLKGLEFFKTAAEAHVRDRSMELYGLRKNDEEFPIELSLSTWQADGKPYYSGIIRDVTESRQAEAVLKHERYLLQSLMDNVPDQIYFKDRESRFLRNNRAHLARFGLTEQAQAVGKTDFDFFPPEHAEEARADECRVMETGQMLEVEQRVAWPDGRVDWEVTNKMPMRDARGEIIGTFGITHDITSRKLAEENLKRALVELERSNSELEQFAYVASHDLQEPLRAVTGCVQLLQKSYGDKLDEGANELIRHAVEGAERMRTLIGDLLVLSRVGISGKPFESTDCNAALDLALANLTVALHETDAQITRDPLPTVMADTPQLTQLFQNLIGNAVKFHGERRPEIHVGAQLQDDHWLFSIRDNGIGIEPQYRERIFGIFQRLHTRTEYPGTGVGLAICKRIVERHGGTIGVESAPGRGSTFYFTIPAKGHTP